MRVFLIWLLSATITFAEAPSGNEAHDIIHELRRSIYTQAELNGGGPEIWDMLEDEAVTALRELADERPKAFSKQNEKGLTPLALAAKEGFPFLVIELLRNNDAAAQINTTDVFGFTAHDHAVLALRQTLLACHYRIDNPFVLVPYLVTAPYFESRQPYPEVMQLLEDAGADPSTARVKSLWLTKCTNDDPGIKERVANSVELHLTLVEATKATYERMRREQFEKRLSNMMMLFEKSVESGRMSQAELDELVAEMYRREGLEPPNEKAE